MTKVKSIDRPNIGNQSNSDDSEVYQKYTFFKELLVRETGHLSNPNLKINNANYKAVIKLGKPVLPFLFEDLFSFKLDWLEAIAQISGVDPVKKEHYGRMELMVEDWKNWQLEHNNTF